MISDRVSHWIETITAAHDPQDLLAGRKEYQKFSGEIFQDDKSYESRMGAFLEWYTFQRPYSESGKPPLACYLEAENPSLSEEDREFLQSLAQSIHSLFQLLKSAPGYIVVKDLFQNQHYKVQASSQNLPFSKKDIFEGRLIPYQGQFMFTGNYCYHPPETEKFIFQQIKQYLQEEKKILREFRTLDKQLKVLSKSLENQKKKSQKLKTKIEKAGNPEKRSRLEETLGQVEKELARLEETHREVSENLEQFKIEQFDRNLPQRRFELIQRLSYMSLKWERSRQIDIHDIYKD